MFRRRPLTNWCIVYLKIAFLSTSMSDERSALQKISGVSSFISAGCCVFVTFMDASIVQGLFSKGIKFHIVKRFICKIIKVIC